MFTLTLTHVGSPIGLVIRTHYYEESECYDVCEINDSKFAIFHQKIQTDGAFSLDLNDYNVVFLAPIEVEKNITIKAATIICLNHISSRTGLTEIHAHGKFIMLGAKLNSAIDNIIYSKSDKCYREIIKERLEMIMGIFKEGISNKHNPTVAGPKIVDALVETFDAIKDPGGEDPSDIDIPEAFQFLNIR